MATYEYACKCGHEFERESSMAGMKPKVKCPECGKQAPRAIVNRTGIVRTRFYDTARLGRGRGGK